MKNINVSMAVWKRLCKLRTQLNTKHFNKTIEILLDNYEVKSLSFPEEKITIVPEQKPKPTREEIIREISEILDKKGY